MEHGGNPAKVRFLGLLFDHGGQGDGLIHGHAQRLRPVMPFVLEHCLSLPQQLFDDLLRRGAGVDLVGIGGQIALQRIAAAGGVSA